MMMMMMYDGALPNPKRMMIHDALDSGDISDGRTIFPVVTRIIRAAEYCRFFG
jgi:hypothetical protein